EGVGGDMVDEDQLPALMRREGRAFGGSRAARPGAQQRHGPGQRHTMHEGTPGDTPNLYTPSRSFGLRQRLRRLPDRILIVLHHVALLLFADGSSRPPGPMIAVPDLYRGSPLSRTDPAGLRDRRRVSPGSMNVAVASPSAGCFAAIA